MEPILVGLIAGIFIGTILVGIAWMIIGTRIIKAPPKPPSPMPFIFCAIGSAVLLVFAVVALGYSIYFINSSQPTMATVISIRESKDKNGNVTTYPIYEYSDAAGTKHQDTPNMSGGRTFIVGSQIPVRFLRTSPAESRIDFFAYHWLTPAMLAFLSVVLAAVSVALRWNYRRLTSAKSEISK
jgi:ABC-type Na+ efflux pump permease subunit